MLISFLLLAFTLPFQLLRQISSVLRPTTMVETRLQERSLTEQVDEIRSLHDLLAAEVKTQSDSMNSRFDRLEAMMFNHISALQATGKAPMDPGLSHPPTPIPNNPDQNPPPTPFTHCPHHLPDPPDPFPPPPRQNYGGLTSRLYKISFPAFDGTELRDWLSKCEQFFDIDGTPQELKVRLAAMHLKGKATQWHTNYMTTRFGLFPSWTDYIIAISTRFCELFDDPLAELVALKQGSDSVVDYRDKFETAWMRLVLPEAHALSIFLANMNPHLSLHTRQFEVTTISAAPKIAALHESSLSHAPTKPQRAPFNPSPYQRSSTPPTFTLPFQLLRQVIVRPHTTVSSSLQTRSVVVSLKHSSGRESNDSKKKTYQQGSGVIWKKVKILEDFLEIKGEDIRAEHRARPMVDIQRKSSIDAHHMTSIDSETRKSPFGACPTVPEATRKHHFYSHQILQASKERRSSLIDNNTSSSIDTRQPPSTQTPISSTDTRSPPPTEATIPSTDILHPTSIDTSSRTSIDTEPRDMVATLVLVRNENGDFHDQEGHLRNASSQRIDAQGAVIPEPDTDATEAAQPIGNALVPVDFHVLDIKLNWNFSLLLGRDFLSIVGALCFPSSAIYLQDSQDMSDVTFGTSRPRFVVSSTDVCLRMSVDLLLRLLIDADASGRRAM
ncbi:hypothetical protein F2Q70_00011291 [Brassica cretica]|uniref:Retrotransposon gag domain-containing protein n=1 Tax=Brassica cretica TaxID=69181 RepID=A0A8S9LV27_BRACR|nr:hypothetical protein F2Q70_00011291 [Brassica cretica]